MTLFVMAMVAIGLAMLPASMRDFPSCAEIE